MSEMNKRIKVHDTIIDFVACKIYLQIEGTQLLSGRLSEKQAMLLQLLVRNYPNNTTRQEIMAELWPNGFISPESVNQIINKTRKAIRDIEKDKIVNDPGKGYRLGALDFLALAEAEVAQINANEPTLYNVKEDVDLSGLLNNTVSEQQTTQTHIAVDAETIEPDVNCLAASAISKSSEKPSPTQDTVEQKKPTTGDSATPKRRATDQENLPKRRASDNKEVLTPFVNKLQAISDKVAHNKLDKSVYVTCILVTFFNMALMASGLYDWAHTSQFLNGIESQPSSRFMQSYDEKSKVLKGRTFKGEYFECVIDVKDRDSVCHTVD